MSFDITKMSRSLREWIRLHDEKYEEHMDRLRDAIMYRWRGVAYYRCTNCKEADNSIRNFHIIPLHDPEDVTKIELEPLCHSCYLYFTGDNDEREIIE